MSTEYASTDAETEASAPLAMITPPADVDVLPDRTDKTEAKGPKSTKVLKEDEADREPRAKRHAPAGPLRDLRTNEEKSLKELIESFGDTGNYRISVSRKEPTEARDATGKMVPCFGILAARLEKPIDEEYILNKYGGGVYELTFKRRDERGSFVHAGHRTVTIAGEPNLAELPRSVVQAAGTVAPTVAAQPPESEKLVGRAFDVLTDQLKQERSRSDSPRDGGNDAVIRLMEGQLAAANKQAEQLRVEMRELANRPAPAPSAGDLVKDKLLDKLMDQDSARLQAVRMQYDSEIRTIKETSAANEQRLRDSFEREREHMRAAQEREIARLTQTHDLMIATIRASYEVSSTATKSAQDTNAKISDSEIRKLERENTELRAEVKELRLKKDKSLLEQAKEIEAVKEALGVGDDSDKTTFDKIVDIATNPDAMTAVAGMFKQKPAEAAPAAQHPPRPQVYMGPGGKRFAVDPESGQLVPLKRRRPAAGPGVAAAQEAVEVAEDGEVAQQPTAPAEAPIPVVDPADLLRLIAFFENAYAGSQEPEVVAQGIRSRLPEEILGYLRDRVAEHGVAQGVDVFLSKVAKLPSTSPLSANQDGKNWIRKVGKALVGE